MSRPHYHFVTGKLAAPALESTLADLAPKAGFTYSVQVLKITVAALLTTDWIAKRLEVPDETTKVILPGLCRGELEPLVQTAGGRPVERGPNDLRDLPEYFGQQSEKLANYGRHDIEIIAEINHAPRLTLQQILALAEHYRQSGADLIDVGCDPGSTWSGVGDAVGALVAEGHRVSIDSYNPAEIAPAAAAGAELVLSVNSTNRRAARDWGIEVVAVPDEPGSLVGLDETIFYLQQHGVRYRLDPIVEPIGYGFFRSLLRYWQVRQQYPQAEMMMGIGNLTELTDVDSSGMNVLLLAICQELGIRSVLTTEVINWARSSVAECDIARQLVHYAVCEQRLPKRVDDRLVMLRADKLRWPSAEQLEELASQITDKNFRIFVNELGLHVMNNRGHWQGDDPFELFEQLQSANDNTVTPDHAFYLGFEMAKALIAQTLHKNYHQDQALNWGLLTRAEESYLDKKRLRRSGRGDAEAGAD